MVDILALCNTDGYLSRSVFLWKVKGTYILYIWYHKQCLVCSSLRFHLSYNVVMMCLLSVSFQRVFAYHFKEEYPTDGWLVYDAADELKRLVCMSVHAGVCCFLSQHQVPIVDLIKFLLKETAATTLTGHQICTIQLRGWCPDCLAMLPGVHYREAAQNISGCLKIIHLGARIRDQGRGDPLLASICKS